MLRDNQERAALFVRFAYQQLRRRPGIRRFHSRAGQTDRELLPALRLAGQVQRDNAPRLCLEFRPMAQGGAADRLDIEPGRHQEAQPENARPRDLHRGIDCQDRPIFAERKSVLRLDSHVGFHRRGSQK